MSPQPASRSRFWIQALYALSLLAMGIYVVTGPALAVPIGCTIGSPTIVSTGTTIGCTLGSAFVESGSWNVIDPYTVALEDVSISCPAGLSGGCSTSLGFHFGGENYFSPFYLFVHLTGTSTDPGANGTASTSSSGYAYWTVSGNNLQMERLPIPITPDSGGHFWVEGQFSVYSLANGTNIQWGKTSLDFDRTDDAVPEPASALILVGGLAWLEFLRRKRRA